LNARQAAAQVSWWQRWRLPPDDLLRDAAFRRIWASTLIGTLGAQVTLLALPLTAALLLHATPTQMGWLASCEMLPFALFSLPSGVWLDRVRKLPVVVVGELLLSLSVLSVTLAWWLGWLTMGNLYVAAFVIGSVYTTAGTAAQVVLTQVVPRERLVEAHSRNALASSSAEVLGPGVAGVLIKLVGPPLALLLDAVMLMFSAAILRGVVVSEQQAPKPASHFWSDLKAGLHFVASHRLLRSLALAVGVWQFCHHAAMVVQILHASRVLGLSEQGIGLCYVGMGLGTIAGSVVADRVSARLGPGPSWVLGCALCAAGWLLPALWPQGSAGVLAFAAMLVMVGFGSVLLFVNFLALRQSVTPAPMLGRMTATMRWLALLPTVPGALVGGWLGEHLGLAPVLGLAAGLAGLLALATWRLPTLWQVRSLPDEAPKT